MFLTTQLLINLKKKLYFRIHIDQKNFYFSRDIKIQILSPYLHFFLYFLKKNTFLKKNLLIDIGVFDRNVANYRFIINYFFLSTKFSTRLTIITVNNGFTFLKTIKNIHNAAIWIEREIYDMFGIFFDGNPDMRRILNDYGFQGFPLRKDFPVVGHHEKYFSLTDNNICNIPISLVQELRNNSN